MGDHYYPYRGSVGFKIPIGVSTGSAGKTTWGQPPPAVPRSAAPLFAVENAVELALDRTDEDICPYVVRGD
jgi:hypothetical protein